MKGMIAGLDERLDRMGEKLEKKEFKIPVDLTGGIIFLLFSIVVLFMIPKQVTISDKDVVNGRLFPTLLMIVMMICCVALIVKELYKIKKKLPLTYKSKCIGRSKSIDHYDNPDSYICDQQGHKPVLNWCYFLQPWLFTLFPLQKLEVLCNHSRNGMHHLGGIPLWIKGEFLRGDFHVRIYCTCISPVIYT